MNVRLELEVPLGSLASNWSQEKYHQVPSLGTARQPCWGLLQLYRRKKACWKLLSISKLILVQVMTVLLWLDLEMCWEG